MTRRSAMALALLLTAPGVFLPLPAAAQNFAGKFIAVTGGATLSDLSSPGLSTASHWGGTAGLILGVRTLQYTIVAIEPAWARKGGEGVNLDYLDVPVTFGGVGRISERWRAHAYTGIGPNFRLGCSSDLPVLDCDDAESVEWGIPLGVRFTQVSPSGTFFSLDVRYGIPLSDAFDLALAANRTWYFRLIVGRGR